MSFFIKTVNALPTMAVVADELADGSDGPGRRLAVQFSSVHTTLLARSTWVTRYTVNKNVRGRRPRAHDASMERCSGVRS